MESQNDNKKSGLDKNNKDYNINKRLAYLFYILVVISLPSGVKCDMGSTFSTMILFFFIALFIFAALGWWSRRNSTK
jgi:hypothetical protein